jgi:hypothetical protein
MLFFSADGSLIEINRYDFKNDKLYHQKIMELTKNLGVFTPFNISTADLKGSASLNVIR